MVRITEYGYIQDGVLYIPKGNKERMDEEIHQLKDCDVLIIIKKRGKRSDKQNRYYWGIVVREIKRELKRRGYRYDAETIHEWLKLQFNKERIVIEATGELIELGGSTTEMNKEEFGSYIDRIREWASQSLELVIPDPNTQTEINYFD